MRRSEKSVFGAQRGIHEKKCSDDIYDPESDDLLYFSCTSWGVS